MNPTSKLVTLPDGTKCKVRRINASDMLACGTIPDVFADGKPASNADPKAKEFGINMTRAIIANCVGALVQTDGKRIKIVDKPFDSTTENEISVDEFMSTDEANTLVAEVMALSGFGQAAQDAARPFSSEQKGEDSSSQTGEAVSVPAV